MVLLGCRRLASHSRHARSCSFVRSSLLGGSSTGARTAEDYTERLLTPTRYDLARPEADSGLESLLRLRLADLGIALECQVLVPTVGRVDFLLASRIILEVDGRLNHDGVSLRHKDLVRDAHAAIAGFEALRFDYALVVHSWPVVEAAILARLAA